MIALLFLHAAVHPTTLWQIGSPRLGTGQFALGPTRYSDYHQDGFYVLGYSKPKQWPYVLPGPDDNWAGSRPHADRVEFGLKGVTKADSFRIEASFFDAQDAIPPTVAFYVNGKIEGTVQLRAGGGDSSINGNLASAKPQTSFVTVSPGDLRTGPNEVVLKSMSGSWALFSSVKLIGPSSARLAKLPRKISVGVGEQAQYVLKTRQGPRQPVNLTIMNVGPKFVGRLAVNGAPAGLQTVEPGKTEVAVMLPWGRKAQYVNVSLKGAGLNWSEKMKVDPVRQWQIDLFPHAHLDVGYTNPQAEIAEIQSRNLTDALTVAQESRQLPIASHFHFNSEGVWILEQFLKSADPAQVETVKQGFSNGTLSCSAAYANILTGLMRPEEMMMDYRMGQLVGGKLGTTFETASQTDVPGVTWGDVTALSQAGIKNLVLMPNFGARIGGVTRAWEDHPFWWKSPSGKEKVFVWETVQYGIGHPIRQFNGDRSKIFRTVDPTKNFIGSYILPRLADLNRQGYPYAVIGLPWSCTDNPPIDGDIPSAVTAWNEKYAVPKVETMTLPEACKEFVRRYGNKIPTVKGDLTPYWEDGAGSSPRETAMNRASADRLVQAEALAAMGQLTADYDATAYLNAWRDVLLYSEHTWGAYDSVSNPNGALQKSIWKVKKGFAISADKDSRALLATALHSSDQGEGYYQVTNTESFPRTDLVTLPPAAGGKHLTAVATDGKALPSQTLHDGSLAVLVRDVPAFGSVQFHLVPKLPYEGPSLDVHGMNVSDSFLKLVINGSDGTVKSLKEGGHDFVNAVAPYRMNQYLYLRGGYPKKAETSRLESVKVLDKGPLVAEIQATSRAPGCKWLKQTYTVIAGINRVDISNEFDKEPMLPKEGLHFAFPIGVQGGQMRVDMPWSIVRPQIDQIKGANKNWMCTQRFVDVSNTTVGLAVTSLDAPLIEVGGMTATLTGYGMAKDDWLHKLPQTQMFLSWVMNNQWDTNYLASQDGIERFRYSLMPHAPYNAAVDEDFGMGESQPLLVSNMAQSDWGKVLPPALELSNPDVIVTCLKPADAGNGTIVRLWNPTGVAQTVLLKGRLLDRATVRLSNLAEVGLAPVQGPIKLDPMDEVTILISKTV